MWGGCDLGGEGEGPSGCGGGTTSGVVGLVTTETETSSGPGVVSSPSRLRSHGPRRGCRRTDPSPETQWVTWSPKEFYFCLAILLGGRVSRRHHWCGQCVLVKKRNINLRSSTRVTAGEWGVCSRSRVRVS